MVQINPTLVAIPTEDSFVQQLSTAGLDVEVYTGSTKMSLAESFGIYFDGEIFDSDLTQLEATIQSLWVTKNTGVLTDGFEIKIMGREKYFRSSG